MPKFLFLIATAAALVATAPANAQQSAADYPNKPVRVIVTVPAGGGVDTVTRIVTEKMRTKLGQPFVIENKGGAGGNIAAESVFQAEPDGYTLMTTQPAPITTNVVLYKKLNFDPTAFEPIAIMSSAPNVLLVKQDFPAKTLAEFMTYVKANPGKLNYASQGPGTTSHLTAELFNKLAGTQLVHVPYKGTGPALIDIAAGHVDMIFMQLEAAMKLHEGGKARILAVTTEKRIAALPDIPTMGEAGLKDFISDTWNAMAAPPKTPAPIVAKLNAAVNDALKMPEVQEQYRKQFLQVGGGTPQDLAKVMKEDTARWSEVIKEAKIPQI